MQDLIGAAPLPDDAVSAVGPFSPPQWKSASTNAAVPSGMNHLRNRAGAVVLAWAFKP